ncbi:MAG: hypothetical protein QOE97_3032 [Pseudonocardiales bacterium]|jgi:hypothetical protein|nr:hypothetical protein [Pseudonocardiales bacterium]
MTPPGLPFTLAAADVNVALEVTAEVPHVFQPFAERFSTNARTR